MSLRLVTDLYKMPRLRIVELVCPYEIWDDPSMAQTVQNLFAGMVTLKKQGYSAQYPQGIIVNDVTDFIGTHLLACVEDDLGALKPIMGFKLAPLKMCKLYRQRFPALNMLAVSGATEYLGIVEEIIRNCEETNTDISYDSAWTMDPETHSDREKANYLREVFTSMVTLFHHQSDIPEWITLGSIRFKTDQHFGWMGGTVLTGNIKVYSSFNDEGKLIHVKSFSDEALRTAEKHRDLWEKRLIFSPAHAKKVKTAA